MLLLGACTRNHGDIGPWFGTWHVESITAGGAPVNIDGDYFFQFQSKVFRVSQVKAHEHMEESFGTWEESQDGRHLQVKLSHHIRGRFQESHHSIHKKDFPHQSWSSMQTLVIHHEILYSSFFCAF